MVCFLIRASIFPSLLWEKVLFVGQSWLSANLGFGSVSVCVCVCLSVWVYPGHIIHHYKGIWATCAPGRRNMHHSGAICTTVHKGDYVF